MVDVEAETFALINEKSDHIQKPWCRLFIIFVASIVPAGLYPGQSEWTTLLTEAKVFSSQCKNGAVGGPCKEQSLLIAGTFQGLFMITLLGFLPAGILFDDWGGRFTGTVGATLNAIGYILLILPVVGASYGIDAISSYAFFPAVIATDLGALFVSYSLFSFLYHFPGQQTMIIALSNASVWPAAFVPVSLRALMDMTSCTFLEAFVAAIAIAVLVIPVIYKWTPDKKEFNLQAQRVTGLPVPQVREVHFWSKVFTVNQIFAKNVPEHLGIFIFLVFSNTFVLGYQANAAAYGTVLFGKRKGDELAMFSATATGMFGLFLGLVSGPFTDRFGTGCLCCICALLVLLSTVCSFGTTSWMLINLAVAVACMYNAVWINFLQKHLVCYLPASRLGVGQGVFAAFSGFVTLFCTCGFYAFAALASPIDAYRIPLLTFGILGSFVGMVFAPWYLKKGVPDMPVLSPSDERDIAKAFGCRTLDDAEFVADIPKATILKDLGSRDPVRIQRLFQGVNSDRLYQCLLKGTPPPDHPDDPHWDSVSFLSAKINTLKTSRPEALHEHIRALGPEDVREIIACGAASFCGTPTTEPDDAHDFLLGPKFRGLFNDPGRKEFFEKAVSFVAHVSVRFGAVLGYVEEGKVKAVAMCFPPGRLQSNSDYAESGGSRVVYAIKQMGCLPPYFDRAYGDGVRLRCAAFSTDFVALHHHAIHRPHWYVLFFGVRPEGQGMGLGRKLMSAVTALADLDGLPCYLEASIRKTPFYEKQGYRVVNPIHIDVDDSAFETEPSAPLEGNQLLRPARRI